MNASDSGVAKVFAWLGLATPFIAVALCVVELNTDVLWWPPHDSYAFTRICLTWRYSFPVSGAVGVLAVIVALSQKEWRLILLPLTGVVLSFLFALLTSHWRNIL